MNIPSLSFALITCDFYYLSGRVVSCHRALKLLASGKAFEFEVIEEELNSHSVYRHHYIALAHEKNR